MEGLLKKIVTSRKLRYTITEVHGGTSLWAVLDEKILQLFREELGQKRVSGDGSGGQKMKITKLKRKRQKLTSANWVRNLKEIIY